MIGSTLTLFRLLSVGAGHGDEPAAPVLGHDGVHRLVVPPLLLGARHRAAQEAVALPAAAVRRGHVSVDLRGRAITLLLAVPAAMAAVQARERHFVGRKPG